MNTAVADNQPWALEVVTPKETVILAWSQFVFAEGGDDEIRIAFASHDIVVRGSGLSTLLQAITTQEARTIRQAVRHEAFRAPTAAARFVREIEIRRIDAE